MVNKTKSQIEIDSRRKIYEQYALKTRRELCMNCRIEIASKRHNMSKNAYIIQAVESALKADGLTLEQYRELISDGLVDQSEGHTDGDSMA